MKRYSLRSDLAKSDMGRAIALGIALGIVLGIVIEAYFTPIVETAHAEETIVLIVPEEVIIEVVFDWDIARVKEEIVKMFPEDSATALKIAACESGFRMIQSNHILSYGREESFGYFQVHARAWEKTAIRLGLEDYKTNPRQNLEMARYIYDSAGKRWNPWMCYTKKMI